MATGATLGELLLGVRAESMQSTNPLQNTNLDAGYTEMLQRVQRQLWNDYAWPHLRARRDVATVVGERYYDFPADLSLDRVESVSVRWSGRWVPIERGIGDREYNAYDSDADVRVDPVLRWAPYEGGQFEAWPLPATASSLRFVGIKALAPLAVTADTCDLDRDLLVLYVAAEVLAESKSPRAEAVAKRAQAHYAKLRQRSRDNDSGMFVLGGGPAAAPTRRRVPLVAVDRGGAA